MNQQDVWKNLFARTRGRFFTVTFVKKNGDTRRLNGQGVGNKITECRGDTYLTVWDVKKHGWRKVNTDTITSFRCGKELSISA